MHHACPNKKPNHLQKQLPPTDPILGPENLLKTRSCPSGRHEPESFIETKTLRFCNLDISATLIQQTSKNEPKHGPKNGTAWQSHFWDRMQRL